MSLIQQTDQRPVKIGRHKQMFPVWASCSALFTEKQDNCFRHRCKITTLLRARTVCAARNHGFPWPFSAYKPYSQREQLCRDQWGKGMRVANTFCCLLLARRITQTDTNVQEQLTIKLLKNNCLMSISLMFCGETEAYKNVHIHKI